MSSLVKLMMVDGTLSLTAGTTQYDQVIFNKSTDTTIYPPLKMTIISIDSDSGRVRVANADDGGNGVEVPATFDYTSAAGADLVPGETSGARRLKFSNPESEQFRCRAIVMGHLREGAGGAAASPSGGSSSEGGSGTGSGSDGSGTSVAGQNVPVNTTLQQTVLTFTVNPLTRTVTLLK